jgi:hypothetical protein
MVDDGGASTQALFEHESAPTDVVCDVESAQAAQIHAALGYIEAAQTALGRAAGRLARLDAAGRQVVRRLKSLLGAWLR